MLEDICASRMTNKMSRRIYPLNSLRAFEASARLMSFVKAAEELHVTPAAVSHQVKRLEEYLSTPLFKRLPHDLLLEEKGRILMSELGEIFLRLDKTVDRALAKDTRGTLTISADQMFAVKLVVPWLYKFNALHPDINVRISSNFGELDFQRDNFDAAIIFGRGKYPGLKAVKLFEESLTPLCSTRYLKGEALSPLKNLEDLSSHVLLHDDYLNKYDFSLPGWDSWLKSAGADYVDTTVDSTCFNQPDHALQAAIDGEGVVLGWRCLASNDIAAGRLIQPFSLALPLGLSFYLVYPGAYENKPEISAFRDWLMDEP